MQPAALAQAPATKLAGKNDPGLVGFLKRRWWVILLIVASLAALVAAGYFAYTYFTAQAQVAGTQQEQPAPTNAQSLVDEIRAMILLPEETPEVATISDVGQLKGQDFFKNAQNGDAVLIFQQAGRGLIYRPAERKIIEYTKIELSGPLNIPQ